MLKTCRVRGQCVIWWKERGSADWQLLGCTPLIAPWRPLCVRAHMRVRVCSEVRESVAFNVCNSYSGVTLSSDLPMNDSNCRFCKLRVQIMYVKCFFHWKCRDELCLKHCSLFCMTKVCVWVLFLIWFAEKKYLGFWSSEFILKWICAPTWFKCYLNILPHLLLIKSEF